MTEDKEHGQRTDRDGGLRVLILDDSGQKTEEGDEFGSFTIS